MLDAARARRRAREGGRLMAILVTAETRLVVQGITGREGAFHATRNRDYGTKVVAGVTPGQGRAGRQRHPGLRHRRRRRSSSTGANTSMVFVPPRFAADAIYEAVDAGIETVICITEGIPAHDMLDVYAYVRARGVTLLGPNCPGALSPGRSQRRHHPDAGLQRGAGRPRLALRHADLPDRQRAGPGRRRQLDDRRHRRRPRSSARRSSTSCSASRPTRRPSSSSWSARSAATRRRSAAEFIAEHMTQAGRRLHRRASPLRRARRWATPERSSPAPRARRRPRRRRSRRAASAVGTNPTEAAAIAAERVRST